MTATSNPHLVGVEVTGLLGQFDHTIKIDPDDEFVIIHGPNGIGKTKLLELISNVFAVNLSGLLAIPFNWARFTFADSTLLTIDRQVQLTLASGEEGSETKLIFNLRMPDKEAVVWSIDSSSEADSHLLDRRYRVLERELPIKRVALRKWRDQITNEILSAADLERRYPGLGFIDPRADTQPQAMKEFLDALHTHLIETQRLINPRRRYGGRFQPPGVDESEAQTATVLEFSEDLKRRFGKSLADNSRTSQQLDRQFPGRLLQGAAAPQDATEDNIRDRYNDQGQIRRKLTEISLLDTSYELPLPERRLDEWERLVLWTYLDDTDKKLATFLPLLERVDLMREIMNSRFLNKELIIDRERGFRFRVINSGDSRELGPDQLSSGEQHELVLVYDLLFNTKPNSLVLIDEPEISLHASWQQEFLSDIIRISNVTSLRFIIATHSPQIIHEWWSRTVQLSPR